MRACVFALAVTAVAQPALASEHHKSSHQFSHRHHVAQSRHHHFAGYQRHRIHLARIRREPVAQGAAMAQGFMRTDAAESGWTQGAQAFPQATRQQPGWQSPVSASMSANLIERGYARRAARAHDSALDAMIARHAAANGVPVELVRRVVTRESGFNPRASNRGNLGLMQIRYATARSMGYSGSPGGLLDAETNLTYAVKYLAGAYHAAGGNEGRAVALYASGYHGRGVAVARRAQPQMVADSGSGAQQPTGWGMQPVAMQSSVVMARRHGYRYRVR